MLSKELFARPPETLSGTGGPTRIGRALGATLYMSGSRMTLVEDVSRQRAAGVVSVVIDFEDAVGDTVAARAVELAAGAIDGLELVRGSVPFVFLRMRSASDVVGVARATRSHATHLTGFVLPKFDPLTDGPDYLDAIDTASEVIGRALVCMPIIEAPAFAFRETRAEYLTAAHALFRDREHLIACVRIGGTDLASAFGFRRTADATLYEIKVIADVVGDVVNTFVRNAPGALPVSAPVWEHFNISSRVIKPRLRQTPFEAHDASSIRKRLVSVGEDVLIDEINLDKLNGLTGKTVIHPSHVAIVHALSVVTDEEFVDATSVMSARDEGGAYRSPYGNKMNEARPHAAWAAKVLDRARVFGVARPGVDMVDFLVAMARLSA